MSDEYEVRAAEHATPEPKAVTGEMVEDARRGARWLREDDCPEVADAIEAVLDERERWNHRIRDLTNYSDKLKADVERLRGVVLMAVELQYAFVWPESCHDHLKPLTKAAEAALADLYATDTPARPEPDADRLGWFAWWDTVGMAIQTDEARASIKVTAGTEKEALALRAECFLLLEPLVRAIEPSANDTKGKR